MRRSVLGPGRAPRGRPRDGARRALRSARDLCGGTGGRRHRPRGGTGGGAPDGLHIAAIAAVTDVGLVVLGGGIGANADLLTDVRPLLEKWLPYAPRLEISSLGDGAVLMGAVSVGLESAPGRVFVSRRPAPR